MRASWVIMGLLLASCTSRIETIEPGPDGYSAIRFLKPVQVRDHAVNIFRFSPGMVLVADRELSPGHKLYCGPVYINNGIAETCVDIVPEGIVIGPGHWQQVIRPIPPDSYESFMLSAQRLPQERKN